VKKLVTSLLVLLGILSITAVAFATTSPNIPFDVTTYSAGAYSWYVGQYGDHIHITTVQNSAAPTADVVYEIDNGMPDQEIIGNGQLAVDWWSANAGTYYLTVWSGACYDNYSQTGVIAPGAEVYGNLYVNW